MSAPEAPLPTMSPEASDGVPESEWLHLHPLTPWLRSWAALVILAGLFYNSLQNMLQNDTFEILLEATRREVIVMVLISIGLVVVVLGAAAAYNILWWRKARFHVGTHTVELRTGLLFRVQRSLRLDQLEAVDIVHPLIARLFGLVKLKLESAGGPNSSLDLEYLRRDLAEQVRNQILTAKMVPTLLTPEVTPLTMITGASGVMPPATTVPTPEGWLTTGPSAATHPTSTEIPQNIAPALPEDHLFRVPPAWTIGAYVRRLSVWIWLGIAVIGVGIVVWIQAWGALAGLFPLVAGVFNQFRKYIFDEMGFTAQVAPEGLRLTHGLTTTTHQTIPAARVQAVRFSQPVLWRKPGWWRAELNIAGYGEAKESRSVLVPVGDAAMLATALATLMPRATTQEMWAVIQAAMYGTGPTPGFITTPERAKTLDPFAWRRQAIIDLPYALVIRQGRMQRQVTIVPQDRIQGMSVRQGPWERSLELADLEIHSTQGAIVPLATHLGATDAQRLVLAYASRVENRLP